MLGLECASFEVTTAFAGLLGPAEVAAHAGVFAITSLCYISLPFALATAATIRVGNLVGAGRGDRAAVASRVVVGLGSTFMAICGLAIYFGRYQLGELFTAGDPEVLRAVAMIAPLGAAYQVNQSGWSAASRRLLKVCRIYLPSQSLTSPGQDVPFVLLHAEY